MAVERNRDEDDSRRLHNVREKKPSSLAPSLPVTDEIRCAGKEKDLNVNDVNTPGQNVFVDASPPRIFWQNWQPDRKVSARTGILGLRWVKKCVGDPTQHQFCTENLGISQQNAHAPIGIRAFRTKKTSQAICRVVIRHRKPDQQKHPTCPSRDSPCVVCGNFGETRKYRSSYEQSPRNGRNLRGLFRCNHVRFIPFPAFAPCFSGSVGARHRRLVHSQSRARRPTVTRRRPHFVNRTPHSVRTSACPRPRTQRKRSSARVRGRAVEPSGRLARL